MKFLERLFEQLFCNHRYHPVRNLYGDEIRYRGWKRSEWKCGKCGKVQYRYSYLEEDDEYIK